MVYSLNTHILTVDANVIGKIDTANPESLFYIWAVFARCAPSVEQGRRLENLSWRLWNRETLCSSEHRHSHDLTSSPQNIPADNKIPEPPQLSGSVESVDEEAVEFTTSEPAIDIKPCIHREDSCLRDPTQPVKSDEFEKMVVSIITEEKPLTAPLPQIAPSTPSITTTGSTTSNTASTLSTASSVSRSDKPVMSPDPITMPPAPPTSYIPTESIASSSKMACNDGTESVVVPPSTRATNVVRGFSPSTASIRLPTILTTTEAAGPVSINSRNNTKKSAMFTCGGSASASETGQSPAEQPVPKIIKSAIKKHGMFEVGTSSAEGATSESLAPMSLAAKKKTTSFSTFVDTISSSENAIESDSEDDVEGDEIDESAIEDEEDGWEDSLEEDSRKSSVDERTYFKRVDSKVHLPSRRSLITLMFEKTDGNGKKLGNGIASQSTSALHHRLRVHNGPSAAGMMAQTAGPSTAHGMTVGRRGPSDKEADDSGLMMKHRTSGAPLRPIREMQTPQRTAAQPINTVGALSPRTTRRNMLSTELTESLRRHMLWERQQKSKTVNAVLQRRHTSHEVANLKQYPTAPYMDKTEGDKTNWNRYFTKEAQDGYHTKGW
ncbi:hypothetical protein Cpir12675_006800 [Ceratocystis pirilliformis]|uniref:Nitrogen regulatory protein areA GATA-like domain-containing protein n=1 Tax=Ceratocystis pirilliformis TaxID=259994 RepID=A0ABR3YFZ3_9PEZI